MLFRSSSRFASTRITSILGISIGVLALIVVIAVMNGFQATSINSLLEISSYHVKCEIENIEESEKTNFELSESILAETECVVPIKESQCLLVGNRGKQNASVIRGIIPNICEVDKGFAEQAKITSGKFDIASEKSIVLGSSLARRLSVSVGDTVSVLFLAGNSDTELFSDNRDFVVTGIFESPYLDINSSFLFNCSIPVPL